MYCLFVWPAAAAAAPGDDDADEDDDGGEEVCPPGCDQAVYERVCDLREKRLDEEDMIAEFQKTIEVREAVWAKGGGGDEGQIGKEGQGAGCGT